jgi:hypothetical protein
MYDGRKDIQFVKLMVDVVHEFATCFDEINRITHDDSTLQKRTNFDCEVYGWRITLMCNMFQ